AFLSSENFIHRRLQARNILLTSKLVVKVGGLGTCRYSDQTLWEDSRKDEELWKWMAPETLREPTFTTESDVYRLMMQCWDADPAERPSFEQIRRFLSKCLEQLADCGGYLPLTRPSGLSTGGYYEILF
ncbi:fibroblast growth factor receptor 4 minus 16 form, partial [Aphelenchoides avenae]